MTVIMSDEPGAGATGQRKSGARAAKPLKQYAPDSASLITTSAITATVDVRTIALPSYYALIRMREGDLGLSGLSPPLVGSKLIGFLSGSSFSSAET